MKLETIKPGLYRLSRDVENPDADRRVKLRWTSFPVWEKGWEFRIKVIPDSREPRFETVSIIRDNCRIDYTRWVNGLNAPNPMLVSALEPVPIDSVRAAMAATSDVYDIRDVEHILQYLVDHHGLTIADVHNVLTLDSEGKLWELYGDGR